MKTMTKGNSPYGMAFTGDSSFIDELAVMQDAGELEDRLTSFRGVTEHESERLVYQDNKFILRSPYVDDSQFVLELTDEQQRVQLQFASIEEREKAHVRAEGLSIVDLEPGLERKFAKNLKSKADKLHDLLADVIAPTELAFDSAHDRLGQEIKLLLKDNNASVNLTHIRRLIYQIQEIRILQDLCSMMGVDAKTTRTIVRARCMQFRPRLPGGSNSSNLSNLLGKIGKLSSNARRETPAASEEFQDGPEE